MRSAAQAVNGCAPLQPAIAALETGEYAFACCIPVRRRRSSGRHPAAPEGEDAMAHSHDRMLRLALCLLALLLAVPAAATNLLSNGSFESGVACGDAMLLGPGSTGIDGWVVTGAGIDYCGTRWTAAYGTR